MVPKAEQFRLGIAKTADPAKRAKLGQFFTPQPIARFMASLFPRPTEPNCRLLDAGAGVGSLSAAFLDRCVSGDLRFDTIHVDAIEVDTSFCPFLLETLQEYQSELNLTISVKNEDFLETASHAVSGELFSAPPRKYTHAILNPPYKKINSNSLHRFALRRAGIETVNLYSAFLALALALLQDRGQLVAIVPRSFCNGPYYRPFREFVLSRSAIKQIHIFDSRRTAFKDDDVLQENIIIHLERNGEQGLVSVSKSTDDTFRDLTTELFPFDEIVFPDDTERFIHIPTSQSVNYIEKSRHLHTLKDIGIEVSTGPVVDFRMKKHLRKMPGEGSVPLLYPGHFSSVGVDWPKQDFKKSNAISHNEHTEKWLFASGTYCITKRFTSKEEKRRVIARVVDSSVLAHAPRIGFENHLNVFHQNKQGLPLEIAYGLAVYLNSTCIEDFFRRFNGHTQVNATDLRLIRYPSGDVLVALGSWAMDLEEFEQAEIDIKIESLIA